MRMLDLFCGNKCVSNLFHDKGWEVVTLDISPKFNPTHCIDILEWDHTTYPRDHFDVIWASRRVPLNHVERVAVKIAGPVEPR